MTCPRADSPRRAAPVASAARPSAPTSICTKFVSTCSRSTGTPASASPRRGGAPARGPPRDARRCGRARRRRRPRRSPPAASRRRTGASRPAREASARTSPRSIAPSGQPSPFEKQTVTVSSGRRDLGGRLAARDRGVEEARAVQVERRAELAAPSRPPRSARRAATPARRTLLCVFSTATTGRRGCARSPVARRRLICSGANRPRAPGWPRHQARVHRRPAELGGQDVRGLLGDQLGAGLPRIFIAISFAIVAVGR